MLMKIIGIREALIVPSVVVGDNISICEWKDLNKGGGRAPVNNAYPNPLSLCRTPPFFLKGLVLEDRWTNLMVAGSRADTIGLDASERSWRYLESRIPLSKKTVPISQLGETDGHKIDP